MKKLQLRLDYGLASFKFISIKFITRRKNNKKSMQLYDKK